MSKRKAFHFYKVTWSPETPEAITLRLDLGNLSELESRHPFFAEELSFAPGETRVLPLPEDGARELSSRQYFHVELRGDGEPLDDFERELLELISEREHQVRSAREAIYPFLDPRGDYAQAWVIRRYPTLSKVRVEEVDALEESDVFSPEFCEQLRTAIRNLRTTRRELEAKDWQFHDNGKVDEPPRGRGRPARFPRSLIRALHKFGAVRSNHGGRGGEVLRQIQAKVGQLLGHVARDDVREAIKKTKL